MTILLLWLTIPLPAFAADTRIIVSIKPLHSLVASVMGDAGTPALLVGGMQSPHGYELKPSQVTALSHADIVFYIGPGLEGFLARPLQTLPASVKKAAMIDAPGMTVLKPRAGGAWEPDNDEPAAASGPAGQDPHIWLEIKNAKAMVAEIVKDLSALYPVNAATYQRNAAALTLKLDALDREIKTELAPVKGKPFIVFHDAFHYFERDYGLTGIGSITLEPEQEPGAKRIGEIRDKVKSAHVQCVFSEPQFNSRVVGTIIEGTDAHAGVIDEHGADIGEGPDLYFTLMRHAADEFKTCLGGIK